MNAKGYRKKYNLDNSHKFNREEFMKEVTEDFKNILVGQGFNLEGGNSIRKIKRSRFTECVTTMRGRFYSIFNGSQIDREEADKIWGYFYANSVIPIKEKVWDRTFDDTRKREQDEEVDVEKAKTDDTELMDKFENQAKKFEGKKFMSNDQIKRNKKY